MIKRSFNSILVLCFSLCSSAETLIKDFGTESPSVQIKSNSDFEQVGIETDADRFEVMQLENPTRLVIDLYGGAPVTNSTTPVSGSSFIDQIRSAKHDDKTRVVFDIAANSYSQNVEQKQGKVVVTFAKDKEQMTVAKASFTGKTTSETALAKNEVTESKLMPIDSSEGDSIVENDIKEEMLQVADQKDSEDKPILESMMVESTEGKNKLLATMTEATQYTFGRTSPSEYLLTLENASLGSGVQDSVVSKQGMGEIRSVRAIAKGSDIQLRIIANPDVVLKAEFDDNTLFVTESEGDTNSMRAQALIEKKSDTDSKDEVKNLLEEDTKPVAKPASSPKPGSSPKQSASPKPTSSTKPSPLPKKEEANKKNEKPVLKPVVDKNELKPIDSVKKVEEEDFSVPDKEVGAEKEDFETELTALEEKQYSGRLISLDLQDTDIDNALRIIAEVSNLNIIASDDVTGKVTLRLVDVPWDQALDVILKTNGLDKVQDGNVVRIAPVDKLKAEREALKEAVQAEEELEPLKVNYVRVSYAKAAELQPLVETVLTERGTVTYDERTNQLIVKDIEKGLKNVSKLVEKLDLRTPQVLIETQIVEAQRRFVRELGSELSFTSTQSPETGNALGYNFPNSLTVNGSATGAAGQNTGSASFFPAGDQSSALSFVLGSADNTKQLGLRLSQGEKDGLVKVVSRPSVAVTNNSPAVIKSVEKLRIKLPTGGGLTVNQGQGAGGNGGGDVATETIEVGIVLNVTAQASPDYFVLMDIDAKSSSLGVRDRGVDGIPPEIERSATSSVLVSSGQTFAMGGIYRISEDDSVAGVPFLKDIPFLGQFFRKTTVADSDEELIFFITPRIIEGSFDDAAMKSVS